MPYVVAQVEIAGHSHFCPPKASPRPGQRDAGRLVVTSSPGANASLRARLSGPKSPNESGKADSFQRLGGAGQQGLCFTAVERTFFFLPKLSRSEYISKTRNRENVIAFFMGFEVRFASRFYFSRP